MIPVTSLVIAGIAVLWTVVAFNRLVRDRNLVREGWSGIDVQLKRRSNLVPSLVETVRGYARHEQSTLERVTRLRSRSEEAETLAQRGEAENALSDQVRHLFALVEDYPDLRADRGFRELQKQLTAIEDQIQLARRYYNGAVRNYNIRVESFPSNLIAGLARFRAEEFFEIESAVDRTAPTVEIEP